MRASRSRAARDRPTPTQIASPQDSGGPTQKDNNMTTAAKRLEAASTAGIDADAVRAELGA